MAWIEPAAESARRFLRPVMAAAFASAALIGATAGAAPAAGRLPLKVGVVRVAPQPVETVSALTGEIVPRREISTAFAVGGRVIAVNTDIGEKVTAGEVLARLDSVQQQQGVAAARAAVESAKANLDQAQRDFRRQEGLLASGSTTRLRRDEAERQFLIARARYERARASLRQAEKALADTVLKAPESGIITARLADPGAVVGAARTVLKLAVGGALDARFDAPEQIPSRLVARFPVRLALLDDPRVVFSGHVREISPLINPATGTVEVKVAIDAPPDATPDFGQAVRGRVRRSLGAVIALPSSALMSSGGGPAVWVVDPASQRVHLRAITVSAFLDERFIVASGLRPGELVVVYGAYLLFPDRRVRFAGGPAAGRQAGRGGSAASAGNAAGVGGAAKTEAQSK